MPGASSALALLVEVGETLTAAANPFDVLDGLAVKASEYLGARCTIAVATAEPAMAEESLAFPIRANGRILGTLTIANPDHNRGYTVDDVHFALVLADRVAVALDNERLRQELKVRRRNVPPSS